ncbi:MAG: hypothetical protein ACFB9M_19330 [Myxococcota bacterium]
MKFTHRYWSKHSPRRVFEIHRDELMDFGPELPGVASVQRRSAVHEGQMLQLVHRWVGDSSVLPGVLKLLVPAWMFVWEDRSSWDEKRLQGHWRISAPYLGPMVRIEGTHAFHPHPEGCEVSVDGELWVAVVERLGGARIDAAVQDLFSSVLTSAQEVIERHLERGRRREAFDDLPPAQEHEWPGTG